MEFKEENIISFLSNFNTSKSKIRQFEGCEFLELYRDKTSPNIYFTYSYWASEQHLENYRNSELFKTIWAKTKPMFSAPAKAWSVDKVETLN